MQYDLAVVGSGMGGSLIAALQATQKRVILFEKEPNLGGCASTFKRGKYHYNAGATTFAGYEDGMPLKQLLDQIDAHPTLWESTPAIRVIQGKKVINRFRDFDTFMAQIQEAYPYQKNYDFWQLIRHLDQLFWQQPNPTYLKYGLKNKLETFRGLWHMQKVFGKYLYQNAYKVIRDYFPGISEDYLDFIDAQLLITLQAKSNEVSFLSAAIGLAYPFHKLYYPVGGMGAVFDEVTKNITEKHTSEQVLKISQMENKSFKLITDKGRYESQKVILNSTVFDSAKLFEDKKIFNFYHKFKLAGKGAFVLYLKIKSEKIFLHHYQIILERIIPNTLSKSFFVSFSDLNDLHLSKDGYGVTISTHTDINNWIGLEKTIYREKKKRVETFLKRAFLEAFSELQEKDILQSFSATPHTFTRYVLRSNAGGIAITPMNFFGYPSTDTVQSNLYNIGDTIFPGQGWPGVAMGVNILQRRLNGEC